MDTQVLVVGAGPVGLMLAAELRLGGADVIVVERLAEPTTESRASTVHARTMELFDQRGLLDELGVPPNQATGHFGGLPLDFGGVPSRHPGLWKVAQARVESLLGQWAAGLGADIRRGHALRAVTQTAQHVEARVDTAGGPVVLRARYLVGCDGEDSTVRTAAGFGFPGTSATRQLLRADVAGIDVPDRRFERLPGGLAIAARRPDGVTRVMVHAAGRPPVAPDFAAVVRAWADVTGEDIGRGTPLWVNEFGDTSRQADRYRRGRVLLAGDAAHAQLPVGGQALNLGLQDAVNLGWKLAAQVGGHAPAGLLDSYHDERHAVGARTRLNVDAQASVLLGGADVEPVRAVLGELLGYRAVRDLLARAISGLDVRYPVEGGDHPLVGARLPCLDLVTDAGRVTTASLLRPARGLLLSLRPDDALDRHAAGRPGRVRLTRAEPVEPGALAGAEAVLVRPDGHVAWVGDPRAPRGLDVALSRWFGPPGSH